MYLLGLGFWFWFSMILGGMSLLLMLSIVIAQILFVAWYGEQIRQMIINLPGYTPRWFTFIDFSKPTKPWDIMGVVFFTGRMQGAVFAKKTSPVTDQFRNMLPKKIKNHLKYIRYAGYIAILLILMSGGITYVQQHGFLV